MSRFLKVIELKSWLKISKIPGDFKHVIDSKILSYYSLSPKNYILTYEKDHTFENSTNNLYFIVRNTTLFGDQN